MRTSPDTEDVELDGSVDVLGFARARRRDANAAEADVLAAAVAWAEQHPPESIHEAATWTAGGGADTGIPLAGAGAPLVAEFCLAEFAVAIGVSTDAGRDLVAAAVELKYRLPRTWARVRAHQLVAWRARRVALTTMSLSWEAAAYVDAQVAPFAHRIGPAALDRLVQDSVARFMPERAAEEARRAADGRHLRIHHHQVSFSGTTWIEGELDLADALDLDAALVTGAEALKTAGCAESLEVRRAMAAGDLARRQLALELQTDPDRTDLDRRDGATSLSTPTRGRKPRQVVLYVHLCETAITGTPVQGGPAELAEVENTRRRVTTEQVRGWCANPHTQVVIRPVIDLDAHLQSDCYEVPLALREQTEVRNRTCVFPWCTRSARRCDCDHVIAYAKDGPTCSCNLAPLCRRHHRLKTHTAWTYTVLEPGTYLWSSPHGYQLLRDPTGTLDVTSDRRPHPDPGEHLRTRP